MDNLVLIYKKINLDKIGNSKSIDLNLPISQHNCYVIIDAVTEQVLTLEMSILNFDKLLYLNIVCNGGSCTHVAIQNTHAWKLFCLLAIINFFSLDGSACDIQLRWGGFDHITFIFIHECVYVRIFCVLGWWWWNHLTMLSCIKIQPRSRFEKRLCLMIMTKLHKADDDKNKTTAHCQTEINTLLWTTLFTVFV